MVKKKLINDIIFIAAIIVICAVGFIIFTPKSQGKYAAVIVDGTETARYLLNRDFETDISTEYGNNHLSISNGAAQITESDCNNGICVASNSINKSGETIVCLPHKLIIKIILE